MRKHQYLFHDALILMLQLDNLKYKDLTAEKVA
jgi:hypothetical protein